MTKQAANPLLDTLQQRFAAHPHRHPGVQWADVLHRLQGHRGALESLQAMEDTGGEPDVISTADAQGALVFFDCSPETPQGRRSLCYDGDALRARKEHKPAGSAIEMAQAMGIALLTQAQYRHLQTLGAFDLKTSSWIATPPEIRKLGGALFCDRRYDTVFVYHNGVQSYYGVRGFRGALTV